MATRRKRATADSQLPAESSGSQVEAEGGGMTDPNAPGMELRNVGFVMSNKPQPEPIEKTVRYRPKGMGPVSAAFSFLSG